MRPKTLKIETSGLGDLLKQSVSVLDLSVRSSNCLKAENINDLWHLVRRTATSLLSISNLGKKSLREIENALARQGLSLGMTAGNSASPTRAGQEADAAANEVVIAPGAGGMQDTRGPEIKILEYLRQFSVRDQAILRARVFKPQATLEELGEQFDVTRERIRQIEGKLRKRLGNRLRSLEGSYMRLYAERLRIDLGAAVPIDRLKEYCHSLLPSELLSEDDQDYVMDFLLWVVGPYFRERGWAALSESLGDTTMAALLSRRDSRGWISKGAASEELSKAGIREEYQESWILSQSSYSACDDGWLPILRTIPDRAEQIVRYRGVPMTAAELCGLADCESERSLRQRLLDDGRLKRISRQGHFALREWSQYSEYSGIAEEISEEIERQGGAATSQHLIETISRRYGVKPGSVSQYLSAPMFIRAHDGQIRLREPTEVLTVSSDPTSCSSLYFIEGRWTFRIEINEETLRGSGRPLPATVAILVGCQPGERRVFRSPMDEIVISWPPGSASGPNVGSVKPDVDALHGHVGDFVFLTFSGTEIEIRVLTAAELAAASPTARLVLMLGLPARMACSDSRLDVIASAVGLGRRPHAIGAADVHAALMRRNEVALANLISEEAFGSTGSILERLENILGL